MTDVWHPYSLPQVPHVTGQYTMPEDPEDAPRWQAYCSVCGWQHGPVFCLRGVPRDRIRDFAAVHGHGLHTTPET